MKRKSLSFRFSCLGCQREIVSRFFHGWMKSLQNVWHCLPTRSCWMLSADIASPFMTHHPYSRIQVNKLKHGTNHPEMSGVSQKKPEVHRSLEQTQVMSSVAIAISTWRKALWLLRGMGGTGWFLFGEAGVCYCRIALSWIQIKYNSWKPALFKKKFTKWQMFHCFLSLREGYTVCIYKQMYTWIFSVKKIRLQQKGPSPKWVPVVSRTFQEIFMDIPGAPKGFSPRWYDGQTEEVEVSTNKW